MRRKIGGWVGRGGNGKDVDRWWGLGCDNISKSIYPYHVDGIYQGMTQSLGYFEIRRHSFFCDVLLFWVLLGPFV